MPSRKKVNPFFQHCTFCLNHMKIKVSVLAPEKPCPFGPVYARLLKHVRKNRPHCGTIQVPMEEYKKMKRIAKKLAVREQLSPKQALNLLVNLAVVRILGLVSAASIEAGLQQRIEGGRA